MSKSVRQSEQPVDPDPLALALPIIGILVTAATAFIPPYMQGRSDRLAANRASNTRIRESIHRVRAGLEQLSAEISSAADLVGQHAYLEINDMKPWMLTRTDAREFVAVYKRLNTLATNVLSDVMAVNTLMGAERPDLLSRYERELFGLRTQIRQIIGQPSYEQIFSKAYDLSQQLRLLTDQILEDLR